MPTLLMRLKGPMQSWGVQSRFVERDSGSEPSKSGVIGLVCAALGRDRAEPIDDLAAMKFGARIDAEGSRANDYHIAGKSGYARASGKVEQTNAIPTNRYFFADADYLVGLESDNRDLLELIDSKLADPVWPLFLGRKSFVPSEPIRIPDGLVEKPLVDALRDYPYRPSRKLFGSRKRRSEKDVSSGTNAGDEKENLSKEIPTKRLRFAFETPEQFEGAVAIRTATDNPVSFENRKFMPRKIAVVFYDVKIEEEL